MGKRILAELTHFDGRGNAVMVDIGDKNITDRVALAGGSVLAAPETIARIRAGALAKGDVLAVARLAGIMAAKQTATLIPLCHALPLTSVTLEFMFDEQRCAIDILAKCRVSGRTGVEMEALTAVSIAALTIYDMCKAIDRGMVIADIRLLSKTGGLSGDWSRE